MKAVSIELTPSEVSEATAKKLRIPVIGIAAYAACDGSEMVDADTFGLMAKPTSHAKTYGSLVEFAMKCYAEWADDVRSEKYPKDGHDDYHMDPAELDKFMSAIEKF
jgi:3-methyl-2-oxobutanoate hydroxymethyltransferase